MMGPMQHFFIVSTVVELLFAIPVGLVLKRIGFRPWWALLCFVPLAALFGLWVLAFINWPREKPAEPIA